MDRNYNVDLRQSYLTLKLIFVKGCCKEAYSGKAVKRKQKEEERAVEETEVEEAEALVPLVTRVNNILNSILSNLEVYTNNHQIHNSNGLYARKSYISNNFKGVISQYKGSMHCEGYNYEDFLDEIMEAPLSETFFYKEKF